VWCVGEGGPQWTYHLEDGFCRNSMAFATARKFGVSGELIERALEIQQEYDRKLQLLGLACGASDNDGSANSGDNSRDGFFVSEDYSIESLTSLLRSVTEQSKHLLLSPTIHIIRHGCHPPPTTEGKSAVYVLLKHKPGEQQTPDGTIGPCVFSVMIMCSASIEFSLSDQRFADRLCMLGKRTRCRKELEPTESV
jgi:hypothetical protein